jgi:hypothetical protein
MSDLRKAGDLGLIQPYIKLAGASFDELRANDEKQAAKLGEHDRQFARLDQELVTLRHLLTVQVEAIDATLTRMRDRLNGR